MNTKFRDIPGQTFNRWTVLSYSHNDKHRTKVWNCKCECGSEAKVLGHHLTKGRTISCGCYLIEFSKAKLGVYRTEPGHSGFLQLLKKYTQDALKRGYVFELTEDKLRELTKANCHYCGAEPHRLAVAKAVRGRGRKARIEHSTYVYNGVDRVDNKIGYIETNVVSCCFDCNMAKGQKTQAEFLSWLQRAAAYQNIKK
jgi:hypothetical protein